MVKQTILVTGGAGYIGGATSLSLVDQGFVPVVFDRKPRSQWENPLQKLPGVSGDIRHREALAAAMKKFSPIAVVHLAANTSVSDSHTRPHEYFVNNVIGSVNVLDAMSTVGCMYMVFSSSAAAFGDQQGVLTEESLRNPTSVYGQTKKTTEDMLHYGYGPLGFRSVVLRYFNVSGATIDGIWGENDKASTKLMPSIIRAHITRAPLVLYGNTFSTPDGTAVRDYVHIEDVVQANILALRSVLTTNTAGVFHIASGKKHSNLEVIKEFEKQLSSKIPVIVKKKRPGEVGLVATSIVKAKSNLHWTPRKSSLETIVRTSFNWWQARIYNKNHGS